MNAMLSVATLIRRYPYAEDALAWHGIDLAELDPDVTVVELCGRPEVDGQRLLDAIDEVMSLYDDEYDLWPVATGGFRQSA